MAIKLANSVNSEASVKAIAHKLLSFAGRTARHRAEWRMQFSRDISVRGQEKPVCMEADGTVGPFPAL